MARALFVDAWARNEEEKGRSLRGELMDQAPKTNRAAKKKAEELAAQISRLNGVILAHLYDHAIRVPGRHLSVPTPRLFGHYLAMQAMGHGVSWFDDHPTFDLKVPRIEFYL